MSKQKRPGFCIRNLSIISVKFLSTFLLSLLAYVTVAQSKTVVISGLVKDGKTAEALPFVNVILKRAADTVFVGGTVTDTAGRFSLPGVPSGDYRVEISYLGYETSRQRLFVGSLSDFLELPPVALQPTASTSLKEVTVSAGRTEEVSNKLDRKTYTLADNITQGGGSVLQAMQNLPGVTVQDGKVALRGNDKIMVLVDGKQTALTGIGGQTSLDNLPASAVERIEIINNPSARYDANGNGGIINIIYKKSRQEGFNGKVGLAGGLGALWVRQENLPGIRPQYVRTPKINPSLSLNYRKGTTNFFFQTDYLYTETLNKNEFVTRTYDDGTVIRQQVKRNRNTHFLTSRAGVDWNPNSHNSFTLSTIYGLEKIIDRGDQPFFSGSSDTYMRLWRFLEDELKTTVTSSGVWNHKFAQPGHGISLGLSYTFHREDEKYFFDNIMPTFTGKDAFKLLSDEHVFDATLDYVRPLKYGRIEGGVKFRYRNIPTNMQFFPGLNSPIDAAAGGPATYQETVPALYTNYVFESKKWEAELGLRGEYAKLNYIVGPTNPVYKSGGYSYLQPFPNFRLGYKISDRDKLSFFYNRRVDRPNDVDIRVFPKYDDAEIIKIGNPGLRPQFTNNIELGYKRSWTGGYLYAAAYHRFAVGTITRIATTVLGSTLLYNVFQNAGRSNSTGLEVSFSQKVSKVFSFNVNANGYQSVIDAFSVLNLYPVPSPFSALRQEIFSGNAKLNLLFHFPRGLDAQLTGVYLAPDIIPQGTIAARYSVDLGLKKTIQKGKGEIFLNATDLFNTLVPRRSIQGDGFRYTSADYYETQVVRVGYGLKF